MREPRRRRPARAATGQGTGRRAVLTIDALGAQGDGVGSLDGRPVYVPATTAGDLVEVAIEGPKGEGLAARLVELRQAGPDRVAAPCPHFGDCGGCAAQHVDRAAYLAWKADLLPAALRRRGFDEPPLRPMIAVAPGTRRRATLAASRRGGKSRLGFHARARHRIVDVVQCLLLLPSLAALLEPLRRLLPEILPEGGSAALLLVQSEAGADLLIAADFEPDLGARQALAAFAEAQDVARVSWGRPSEAVAQPIALRRAPVVRFAGVPVVPPPGPFLQPSLEGEAALTAAVVEAVADGGGGGARRIADLFAGCGTFSLPLAASGARLLAVDGAGAALEALLAGARAAGLGPFVAVERRDLESRPLLAAELDGFDAVVFDPPRAGAKAQAEAIARSAVSCAVAVSCNPATFARDARTLVDGGFRLAWIQPVDQFPWSGHLELVAAFYR